MSKITSVVFSRSTHDCCRGAVNARKSATTRPNELFAIQRLPCRRRWRRQLPQRAVGMKGPQV
jgi:hypothetical protein